MSPASLLESLTQRQELDSPSIQALADFLLDPQADATHKADLLRALSAKGETAREIADFVRSFLEHALKPPLDLASLDRPAIDICGTGGDQLHLFNVSTTALFVLAACGVAVVKHGNRGITSKSGGADVLEALGVRIDLAPDRFAESVRRHGAAFMLAPQYHPAFAAIAPVRRQLAASGTRTIFNIIGPLLNPLQPPYQLAGVFDPALPNTYAGILQSLGRTRAWAVHGHTADGRGMDEVSTLGPTFIAIADPSGLRQETFHWPAPPVPLETLQGGDASHNAAILLAILDGSEGGPKRDLVLVNVAAALQVAGLAHSWDEGLAQAEHALETRKALAVLRALQDFS